MHLIKWALPGKSFFSNKFLSLLQTNSAKSLVASYRLSIAPFLEFVSEIILSCFSVTENIALVSSCSSLCCFFYVKIISVKRKKNIGLKILPRMERVAHVETG